MRWTRHGPSLRTHRLGPHPLIQSYLERMNFRSIIRGCLGAGLHQSLDHAEVLGVLIHNVLVSRGPMYRIRQWAQGIEAEALGLTAAQVNRLNDDRIARSLDRLASERGRSVFFRLALRVIKHFEIQTPRVHFDTTTVTLFGQYAGSWAEPRITRGINKDHRPDLKQLLFGLNVSSDGAVPLLHHVLSGNRTDDSVHVRNVDQLRSLLGREDFIYVADSKLCTSENLRHLTAYGGQFVTVMPRTYKEDRLFRQQLRDGTPPVRWRKIHTIPNRRRREDPPDVYGSTSSGPTRSTEGYRIIWVRSSQKADLDHRARSERLRKAEVELKLLGDKLGRRSLSRRQAVRRQVATILSTHRVGDFLDVGITAFTEVQHRYLRRGRPKPGAPRRRITRRRLTLVVSRKQEALRGESRTDGVFPLLTSLADRSKRAILEIYKYQPYLEKRFALTKSEYGVAPIFLKKPRRVVALLHVYFIAIMLSALLERQVRAAMTARALPSLPILPEGRATTTPTTPRILENFADIVWHEFQDGDRVVNFPVQLNETQEVLLQLSDVPEGLYR